MATNTLSSAAYHTCSGSYCHIQVQGTVTDVTGLPSGWALGSQGHIYWDTDPNGSGSDAGLIGIWIDDGSTVNYHYPLTDTGPTFYTPGATYYLWTKAWIYDGNGVAQVTLKSNVKAVTT